jgi:GntR family transcriptional regulator, vanillate catabolism transcriptional regulator
MRSPVSLQDASANQTLKAVLYLREMVLAGELVPGQRIAELNLVDLVGVSRTPIRAALARLFDEGLLDELPTGGYAVRRFTELEVKDAIEIRGTLEGLAARLAAERGISTAMMDQAQDSLQAIDQLIATQKLNDKRFAHYIELNQRFHSTMLQMAQSPALERELLRVNARPFAGPSAFVKVQGQAQGFLQVLLIAQSQHKSVLQAILCRESARAESLMREHARIAHHNLASALRNHQQLKALPGGALIHPTTKQTNR